AKVEVDNLKLTLNPIAIEFKRLQVANPNDVWKNIFETGKVRFSLNFGQLIRGKYIIETMEINDVVLGTKRSTSGFIPKKPEPPRDPNDPPLSDQLKALVTEKMSDAPIFDLSLLRKQFKIDSLLNYKNLKSVQHFDTLKSQVLEASKQWDATLADIEKSKQQLKDAEATVRSINVNQVQKIDDALKLIDKVDQTYKTVQTLNATFVQRRTAITDNVSTVYASAKLAPDVLKSDYQGVMALAKIPDLSTSGLTRLLLGKKIFAEADKYLYWVDYAKTTIPKYMPKPEIEYPKRFKGQDIHFPVDRAYPKFWIKKIAISGGEDRKQDPEYIYGKGEVKNVTNNQTITGVPLTISLAGTKGETQAITFDARFDRTKPDASHDNYKATLTGMKSGDFVIGQADFLPGKISGMTTDIAATADVPGRGFDARVGADFKNLSLVFDRAPANDVERIVRSILEAVHGFHLDVRFWNAGSGLDVALATDLDTQIANRTKQVIGEEIAKLEREVRAKVDEKIAEKRKEFEKIYDEKKKEVDARIADYQKQIDEKLAMVEAKKKELETKVEEEKNKQINAAQKKVESEAKKKLEDLKKNIFK
ncbi:MAG TPA: TIGR03545 family protein, partial [Bacteroidota bacterium]|nr:TIGR03545 family protein [Bacteroidota bacterium]